MRLLYLLAPKVRMLKRHFSGRWLSSKRIIFLALFKASPYIRAYRNIHNNTIYSVMYVGQLFTQIYHFEPKIYLYVIIFTYVKYYLILWACCTFKFLRNVNYVTFDPLTWFACKLLHKKTNLWYVVPSNQIRSEWSCSS